MIPLASCLTNTIEQAYDILFYIVFVIAGGRTIDFGREHRR